MEIEYGFDPLAYDEGKDGCVTVIVDTPEEERDENVTASVEITIKKENLTQATEIEKASKNDASWNSIDENSPWFIGVPYEFDCPQDFERAKLTFTYDTSVYTGDDETLQPRIYYYNEETNQLEEVENQSVDIEKGEVSAEVSHFSTYVLLSKRGFDRALSLNALMYKEGDYSADEIAVIFVVDCSGSMAGNDPITYIDGESTCKRKQLINDIVDEMKNQSDEDGKIAGKAGLILFNGDVISDEDDKKPVCSLTDDYSKFSDGLELIGNYGGTYFKPAINLAIEELKQTDLPSKNIIMISDGQDNEWSNLETVKKYFEDKDVNGEIVIHTIGLGAGVDQENLRNISTATGGEYFYAADADQLLDFEGQLLSASSGSKSNLLDADKDEIPDYYELYGMLTDKGIWVRTDPKKADTDGDGLKDGLEIKITRINREGLPFFEMFSDPNKINGKKYDRTVAVDYAYKWYDTHNPDYMPMDDENFVKHYRLYYGVDLGTADCANFISQCLYAGGINQTDDWYYSYHKNTANLWFPEFSIFPYITKSGVPTFYTENYYFSPEWVRAYQQYKYFSNLENGYTAEKSIVIKPGSDTSKIIEEYDIQKGDLLYWAGEDGKTVHHATIISNVDDDILFAGHTNPAFDYKLSEYQKNETVIVVKMRNYYGF